MVRAHGTFFTTFHSVRAADAGASSTAADAVDKTVEDAAARTKAQLAAAGGFGGTIQTGGQGVTTPAFTTNKTLLGQ